jgi:multidrug efflux pump subunit AcrA (membrane-fusion protein)
MTIDIMTPATPMGAMRGLVASGVAAVGIFVMAGGIWSAFAPLESAAVGPGQVEAESLRKRIEHLEGGIIGQILVHDGDAVKPGQVLVRLDDTKARTTLSGLRGQHWDALANQARLLAERDGAEAIGFPEALTGADDAAAARVMAGQQNIFETRRLLLKTKSALYRQRIAEVKRGDRRLHRSGESSRAAPRLDRGGGRRSAEAGGQGAGKKTPTAPAAARPGRYRRPAGRSGGRRSPRPSRRSPRTRSTSSTFRTTARRRSRAICATRRRRSTN